MAQQKEARLVNEWMAIEHPNDLQWKRVRLGPLPDKQLARMYMITLRWADAIFIKDNTVNIVEAKLKPELGAISQLEAYRDLFPQTPEFTAYKTSPIHLIYLCTRKDPVVERMCEERGIEYVIYAPKWLFELPQRR